METGARLNKILIVDDEENLRHMLGLVLKRGGYEITTASSTQEALTKLAEGRHDLLLTDVRMPHGSGLELLKEVRARFPATYVVLMTAYGSLDLASEALSLGAYDYLAKPFKPDEILLTLRKIEEREGLIRENQHLRAQVDLVSPPGLVGQSPPIREVGRLIRRFAPHKTTVLITGESGTGKELVARAMHSTSERRDRPFVAVNCAAIPENLLESELFGHARGAFTGAIRTKRGLFEEADTGTLFLDEIGDLPLALQSKLLRALETEEIRPVGETRTLPVDVRILCATARPLLERVARGLFREDLYYRIHVLSVHLPPLRERREDIPLLVESFMERSSARAHKHLRGVNHQAMERLLEHSWPGNVRELEHAIEHAVILSEGAWIEVQDLPLALRRPPPLDLDTDNLSIKEGIRRLERRLITRALEQTGGNRTQAALLLEISHRALLYKLKDYALGGHEDDPA